MHLPCPNKSDIWEMSPYTYFTISILKILFGETLYFYFKPVLKW